MFGRDTQPHFTMRRLSRERVGVVCLLSLLWIAAGYSVFIRGVILLKEELFSNTRQLKREFETLQQKMVNAPEIAQQVRVMRQQVTDIGLPSSQEHEIASVLQAISKIGVMCGLTFDFIAPASEIKMGVYFVTPIHMIAHGEYPQFAAFTIRLAQTKYGIALENFVLEQAEQEGRLLKMNLTLNLYREGNES